MAGAAGGREINGEITSVVWSATNLPTGLSINASTGVISGTPTTAGTYTPTVKVVTNYGTDSKTITINVAAASEYKPVITSGQVINITAGEEMTPYTVTGTYTTLGVF